MAERYYELLGVSESASTAEIQQAYRERLKESHPDVSDSDDASEQTKELIEAKETLTDQTERKRYDRQGHESYVSASTETATSGPKADDWSETVSETDKRRNKSRTKATYGNRERKRQARGTATSNTENVGSGAAWARTDEESTQAESSGQNDRAWHVWSSDRAYAVERGVDALGFDGFFGNQHAFVLLGTTFLVYPVLLFGALTPRFPLGINLFIAACVIFVIAFLQSVPEIGILVFGSWTILLPPLLFGGLGFDILSLQSVFAVTAVVFPLGLSTLTRIAIRPITAG
ncbi:J domain-containing protein [Halovenus rubra]|uniref:J domain-containing protein n=2 Tax=Halovenus rubra TaxID=869890 RepID=A0ABD5XC73_9EURY|nr:DnaJ domain-containing protein [Halovenus rubra]